MRLDAAHLADEVRVGAFARARRAPEQDQLLGKTHPAAAELPLQLPPDGAKDELRILDFQLRGVRCGRQQGGGRFLAPAIAPALSLASGCDSCAGLVIPIVICN